MSKQRLAIAFNLSANCASKLGVFFMKLTVFLGASFGILFDLKDGWLRIADGFLITTPLTA
jgi:hypothetical protein